MTSGKHEWIVDILENLTCYTDLIGLLENMCGFNQFFFSSDPDSLLNATFEVFELAVPGQSGGFHPLKENFTKH